MTDDESGPSNVIAFPYRRAISWQAYERLLTEWLANPTTGDARWQRLEGGQRR
jgi:hypothetical protein